MKSFPGKEFCVLPARLFVYTITLIAAPAGATGQDQKAYPADHLIVKAASGVGTDALTALRATLPVGEVRPLHCVEAKVRVLQGMAAEDALAHLQGDSHLQFAEPDYHFSPSSIPNYIYFPLQYNLHNTGQSGGTAGAGINAQIAWDTLTDCSAIPVAIIDTGTDYTYTELTGNIWTNAAEIQSASTDDDNGYVDDSYAYDFVDDAARSTDGDSHVTHMAGIAGAQGYNGGGTAGICWTASLMILRVIGPYERLASNVVEAVAYAIDNGATVLYMSFESADYSAAVETAPQDVNDAGVLIVASGGNDNTSNDATPEYPASSDVANLLSVGATDRTDALAGFSNCDETTVDLAAPGVSIPSITPDTTYCFFRTNRSRRTLAAHRALQVEAWARARRRPKLTITATAGKRAGAEVDQTRLSP